MPLPPPDVQDMARKLAREWEQARQNWLKRPQNDDTKKALASIDRKLPWIRKAALTGRWKVTNIRVAVMQSQAHISPKIDTLARDEQLDVLEIGGSQRHAKGTNWWRVRTPRGQIGYVPKASIKPSLPVELSTAKGKPGVPASLTEIELAARG